MRRLLSLVLVLIVVPASAALGADLDELLDDSLEASYSAEQVITCNTPEGNQDAVVKVAQANGELHVGAPIDPDVEVSAGLGGWALVEEGAVVSSANVASTGDVTSESRYAVDEGSATEYLGREATSYLMVHDDLVRAELVVDNEIGAMLKVVTFNDDGTVYCERRFIAFDPSPPEVTQSSLALDAASMADEAETDLPETVSGFDRLDAYEDDEGFVFAYYSDGFFSFAVFRTPSLVTIEDGSTVTLDEQRYVRSFSPGQVTYAWETRAGGMALVGDLPPDMHEAVLTELPRPEAPGLFRRLWRSLFG